MFLNLFLIVSVKLENDFTLETQNLAKQGMLMMQMLKNISLANIFMVCHKKAHS